MPFARHVLELNPSLGTIGLLPCAYDWTDKDERAHSYTRPTHNSKLGLYWNLVAMANASIRMCGKVAAPSWWQGGRDASHEEDAIRYRSKLEDFFDDVRAAS